MEEARGHEDARRRRIQVGIRVIVGTRERGGGGHPRPIRTTRLELRAHPRRTHICKVHRRIRTLEQHRLRRLCDTNISQEPYRLLLLTTELHRQILINRTRIRNIHHIRLHRPHTGMQAVAPLRRVHRRTDDILPSPHEHHLQQCLETHRARCGALWRM